MVCLARSRFGTGIMLVSLFKVCNALTGFICFLIRTEEKAREGIRKRQVRKCTHSVVKILLLSSGIIKRWSLRMTLVMSIGDSQRGCLNAYLAGR